MSGRFGSYVLSTASAYLDELMAEAKMLKLSTIPSRLHEFSFFWNSYDSKTPPYALMMP